MKKIMVVSLLILVMWNPIKVQAASGNFSVEAIIPENQINPYVTFFDISLEPGATQTLEVLLVNHGDYEIIVLQEVNSARTNNNGVIDYNQSNVQRDPTLVHSFADIATFNDTIILPARSSKTVEIEINLPDEPFEGVILGGLRYQEKIPENHVSNAQIENRFAFVLGLRISVGDVSELEPQLQLNDIFPSQRNYRNMLEVNLQNTEAMMVSELVVDARVYMVGDASPIRTAYNLQMRMAPNSNFNFPISWEYQPFVDGEYILEMTVIADGRVWNFREYFTIDNSEELNEIAILEENLHEINPLLLIALAVATGAVLGIGIMKIVNKRKKKDD